MNDIDARSVETYGGFFAEFRVPSRSTWTRLRQDRTDKIFDSAFEAECMAWRELRDRAFGVIRSTGQAPTNARTEAERIFGSIFQKGRAVPVERK